MLEENYLKQGLIAIPIFNVDGYEYALKKYKENKKEYY